MISTADKNMSRITRKSASTCATVKASPKKMVGTTGEAIFHFLAKSTGSSTGPEIYAAISKHHPTTLSTVYRALADLDDCGFIEMDCSLSDDEVLKGLADIVARPGEDAGKTLSNATRYRLAESYRKEAQFSLQLGKASAALPPAMATSLLRHWYQVLFARHSCH